LTAQEIDEDYILKNTIFGFVFDRLKNADPRQFKTKPSKSHEIPIHISLSGGVQGYAGPFRQLFSDISKELRNVLSFFILCPNAQEQVGMNRDKCVINPSCCSPLYLEMYRFIGQLMGMAFRTGTLFNEFFSLCLLLL
jgi:hypothetical protein